MVRRTGRLRAAVLLTALLALAACSRPQTGAIRIGLASAAVSLDPRLATDATSERLNRLLYRHLVDHDAAARPVPALADWRRLGPRHYRFHLRGEGRLFHDGTRLTAADVVATYRSVLDPATASPHRGALAMIERVEAVDDDTVDFFIGRADPLFPGYLGIGILPAAALAAGRDFARRPLGSGPFRLESWPDAGRLRLRRLRDGRLFVFERVADPTMRVLKLLHGEIDLLQNDLPPELLHYLETRPGVKVARRPGSNFAYLGFQLRDADTGKAEVRQAVALAIDRRAIIDALFDGGARPAATLLPPEHWAGAPALVAPERDLARARELLAGAGYSRERPLRLTYKTSADPFRVRIATVIQHQLGEAGIRVRVQSYDWGTFYGDIKNGRFQLFSLAWVGVRMPDIFRYAFHSESVPPAGANRGRLADARVDALIEAAEQAQDLDEKARLYRQLQARLLELLPCVPLWYEDQFVAYRDSIQGYRLAADGNYDGLAAVRLRRGGVSAANSTPDGG